MKQVVKLTAYFLITLFIFASCKKGITDSLLSPSPIINNKLPVANAGIDQLIFLPTDSIVLSGSGSSTDGSIISYRWTKVTGPLSFNIADTNVAVTKVKNLNDGIYEFELEVTDNKGLSAKDSVTIIVNINNSPVANAGMNVSVTILSCYDRATFAELDGAGSSDPDDNIAMYNWIALYGSPGYIFKNPTLSKTNVEKLSPGIYAFELTVTDLGGLSSKDTVLITIYGTSGIPKKYDMDITVNTTFTFLNDYNNMWEDTLNFYYDETFMRGKTIFQPFGEFDISVFESADSAALSDILYSSSIQIRTTNVNSYLFIDGTLAGVNFKKLIREGGGSFTGTFTVKWGSAEYCVPNVFTNLTPLTVTGSLNTATKMITLRINGEVYF